MRSDLSRLKHEEAALNEKIKENKDKVKMNVQLPYLVGNVVEVSYIAIERDSIACRIVHFFIQLIDSRARSRRRG